MSHAIPKIHFGVQQVTADTTNADVNLTNIADTSLIEVDMYVSGPGIQDGTKVVSKTTISVELSLAATATAAAQEIEFFKKIEFDFPPIEPKGEKISPQERRSVALSGLTQVSIDYIEGFRDLNFRFLTNVLYLQLKYFYDNYAVYGEDFRYYEDKTLTDYLTYELRNFDWNPEKIAPRGNGYVWGVPLQLRRVI